MKKPRVLLFDVEATNLAANFGYLLCIAWKWSGAQKLYHMSIADTATFAKDPTNDRELVQEFRKVVEDADIIVGHYSSRFDYPFLQARALYHSLLPFPTDVRHVDTWRISRNTLKLNSNRLASLAAHLGVEEKTALSGPIWIKAMSGHKPSIKYVVEHCRQDVVVLEQVYEKIKPLRPDNPKASLDGCPTCGSESLQSRGYARTTKRKMQRWSCNACGHWHRTPLANDR